MHGAGRQRLPRRRPVCGSSLSRIRITRSTPVWWPWRIWRYGQQEVFFDDTQLEVQGKHFEGAAINYHGDLALSWQTLWVGPFLADSHIGSPKDVSDQLPSMLDRNRDLWRGHATHF